MSLIRMFRVNAFDPVTQGVEIYFKAENDDDRSVIANFCVADDGIYYYRKRSKILSRKETKRARETPNGFISMETLTELFETLVNARLARREEDGKKLKITRHGKSVTIELDRRAKE